PRLLDEVSSSIWNYCDAQSVVPDGTSVKPESRRAEDRMSADGSEWIGLRLLQITNRYLAPVHVAIEDRYGLTRDDVAVIVHLASGSATAQEIVRHTGRPKNSMSRSVVSLEQRGIIRRRPHP